MTLPSSSALENHPAWCPILAEPPDRVNRVRQPSRTAIMREDEEPCRVPYGRRPPSCPVFTTAIARSFHSRRNLWQCRRATRLPTSASLRIQATRRQLPPCFVLPEWL